MKKILIIAILGMAMNTQAQLINNGFTQQQRDSLTFKAGNYLSKFSTNTYVGLTLATAGTVMMVTDKSSSQSVSKIGIGMIGFGTIFQLIAPSKVGKAGALLRLASGQAVPILKFNANKNQNEYVPNTEKLSFKEKNAAYKQQMADDKKTNLDKKAARKAKRAAWLERNKVK